MARISSVMTTKRGGWGRGEQRPGVDDWRAMAGSPTTLSCSSSSKGRGAAQGTRQRRVGAAEEMPGTKIWARAPRQEYSLWAGNG